MEQLVSEDPGAVAAITAMVDLLKEALGDALLGIYTDGSLATGAFSPNASDIDLVAVTNEPPSEAQVVALSAALDAYRATGAVWADEVELTVGPRDSVKNFDPQRPPQCWVLERGSLEHLRTWRPDAGWLVHIDTLRRHGISLYGPEAESITQSVSAQELRSAMAGGARHLLGYYQRRPEKMNHPGTRGYVVLTCCRLLYTFQTGLVASKPEAARWGLSNLPSRWHSMIEAALSWQKTDTTIEFTAGDARDLMLYAQNVISASH